MKNIFRFLAVALLATGIVVACGKDDPKDEPTPPNPDPTPDSPVTPDTPKPGNEDIDPQGTITITWDDSTHTINSNDGFRILAINGTEEGYVYGYLWMNGESRLPWIRMAFHPDQNVSSIANGYKGAGSCRGFISLDQTEDQSGYDNIDTNKVNSVFGDMGIGMLKMSGGYKTNLMTGVQTPESVIRGTTLYYEGWTMETATIRVTSFNPAWMRMSYTIEGNMFDFKYCYDKKVKQEPFHIADADHKTLKIVADNFKWEDAKEE